MRPILLALLAGAALAAGARGDDGPFEDAALHAVQFIDRDEGWAVGDEGAVWHTIDGGKSWERQATGVRASLRSLHFLTPWAGWVAGREELPHGGGSAGVLLFTGDGGLTWRKSSVHALPGLNRVWFLKDGKTGYAAGDGSDEHPSGLYRTTDGGRSWQTVPGPRCTSWLGADFTDGSNGALAGSWNRLAQLRQGKIVLADIDTLGGRNVRGVQVVGQRGVAVGQGGLVLLCDDINATPTAWGYANLARVLPLEVRAGWDFHAVSCSGKHVWAAGRPGSVVLHSGDGGASWEVQQTGQPVPLQGLCFLDDQHGWAVGDLGTILATGDGGKTWKVQRRGGERAAVLFLNARANGLPADTVAILGAEEGYLTAAVRVHSSDPSSAAPARASEADRFAAAVRTAGGAAGETLWQFPLPQHLLRSDKEELLRSWERLHGNRVAEQLLRQLVLAVRLWRPAVVVTDNPDARATGYPVEALLAEAVHEAVARAADPKAFPEQLQHLHLAPWQVQKVYCCWAERKDAHVGLDLTEPAARLRETPRDHAAPAVALLADTPQLPPAQRYYRLVASKIDGATNHRFLMDGIILAPGGAARRMLDDPVEMPPKLRQALQQRRNLQALAEAPAGELTDPDRLLGLVKPSLEGLPYEQAVPAVFALGSHYARLGQWTVARETFLALVDHYPSHPLAADAYRWLIRYQGSSEARRRQEMGQFLVVSKTEFVPRPLPAAVPRVALPGSKEGDGSQKVATAPPDVDLHQARQLTLLGDRQETRRWYQGCLEIEPHLAAFGPLYWRDPSIQFCLQAARRNLGDFDTARKWYARFAAEHPEGPWHDAAAAELWLANRRGPAPKPVLSCRHTDLKPFLDGKLDDDCWQAHRPAVLHQTAAVIKRTGDANDDEAVKRFLDEYPTEVWLAYDKEFLYLAARCKHPAGKQVPLVKVRPRDADLRPYDRISLLLDLDRDYSTCFQLQIDQRGCVCEDCWGDLSWNPRWFVAARSDETSWQVEAAIPLAELTGDGVTVGRAWACNVVRVLPGRGVQSWSGPADVQPRPEGMGLLLFTQEQQPTAQAEQPPRSPAVPMPKVQ
jgi:photosystem II stability/assembly factor-like uncharacterized protein/tetratricopeptide (TPR) repeat protein